MPNNPCKLIRFVVLCCLLAVSLPAWRAAGETGQPTHQERESIGSTKETRFKELTSFCLNSAGNLLCCDAGDKVIRVISPVGKLMAVWKVPFAPHRICCAEDGTVYVGGEGVLARLDAQGKVIAKAASDGAVFPNARVSGLAATKDHLFVSLGNGWSLQSKAVILRFNRDLKDPSEIARDLRGCCQRLDLAAHDGSLYAAENARYRVVRFDAEGKSLSSWGSASRDTVEGFGSCCNPMNLFFGPGGELYTAESGMGRIKRYTPDGKFLGLIGEVGVQRFTRAGRTAASCSNMTLAVSKDGNRIFVQDVAQNVIRVLLKEGVPTEGAPAVEATLEVEPGTGAKPYGLPPGGMRQPGMRRPGMPPRQ